LITPVPGGVGPLTVSMLIKNVIRSWSRKNNIHVDLDEYISQKEEENEKENEESFRKKNN